MCIINAVNSLILFFLKDLLQYILQINNFLNKNRIIIESIYYKVEKVTD